MFKILKLSTMQLILIQLLFTIFIYNNIIAGRDCVTLTELSGLEYVIRKIKLNDTEKKNKIEKEV